MNIAFIIILALVGFVLHLKKDCERSGLPFKRYLYISWRDVLASLIMSAACAAVLYDQQQLSAGAALSVGYFGDSFFRWIVEKGKADSVGDDVEDEE